MIYEKHFVPFDDTNYLCGTQNNIYTFFKTYPSNSVTLKSNWILILWRGCDIKEIYVKVMIELLQLCLYFYSVGLCSADEMKMGSK